MRVFRERQPTDNYTGCVLSGKMNYAYFPIYKNEIQPAMLPIASHKFRWTNNRAFSMLATSVGKFLIDDLQDYSNVLGIMTDTISGMDEYCVKLEFYTKGELQLDFDFRTEAPIIMSEFLQPNALLSGLIYILSNLTEQQNLRIEYICFGDLGDDKYVTRFYSSKHVGWDDKGRYDASIGISFDTPDRLKTMENERMLTYAKVGVEVRDCKFKGFINAFIMSGQIINTGTKVLVFRGQDDGSVGLYEFDGFNEFRFAGPRQVPFLNSSDLTKIIGNNQKEVIT